jgi:THUMP domain-containing protein
MNDDPTVLLTPRGAAALARVAALRAADPSRGDLAVAAELRREFPADLAAAAMAQWELREAAAAKFSRAREMLFTRGGYEQASGEVIARHRAARFAAARRIADLCCGIGGDLLALASPPAGTPAEPGAGDGEAGLSVREILAVDRDPAHARLALHNARVYGGDGVRALVADVRDVPLTGFDAVFIDPARRADTRGGVAREVGRGRLAGEAREVGRGRLAGEARPGRFRAGVSEPPLDWCAELAGQVPAVCVKAAPGLPAELIPPGWEAEFIADGRDLKEAVLWSPAFAAVGPGGPPPDAGRSAGRGRSANGQPAAGPRRATVLPGGHTMTAVPGDPVGIAEPGAYLLDPSPAVTRAGLVEDLARTLGGRKIDEQIAFITVDHAVATPFARTLRVLHSAPWNEKRFAARLRELGIGAADLRRRGLAGDVDQIRRRLKLAGPHRATIVLTRVADRPWGLICADAHSDSPL